MINVILTMEGFVMSPKTEVKMEERFHLSIWTCLKHIISNAMIVFSGSNMNGWDLFFSRGRYI